MDKLSALVAVSRATESLGLEVVLSMNLGAIG